MTNPSIIRAMHDAVINVSVDKGRLIDIGFQAMFTHLAPPDTSEEQRHDMRCCYFLGAQHLWASVMTTLGATPGETEKDMKRMDSIDAELREFMAKENLG